MKILVLSNLYPPDGYGGYERQTAELVDALIQRGHELSVLTSSITARSVQELSQKEFVHRALHLSNEYVPLVQEPAVLRFQRLNSRLVNCHNNSILVQELKAFRPDAVMLCNLIGLGGLQILSTLSSLRVPWVWGLGDTIPVTLCDLGDLQDLVSLTPVRRVSERWSITGTFISLSKKLYKDIAAGGCDLDGPMHLIPYGLNCDEPAVQRAFFAPERQLRLCFASYVSSNKGMDIVLNAVKLLIEGGQTNFVLNIYGAGDVEQFKQLASDCGIDKWIRFGGFRNSLELAALYSENDVLLFPSMMQEPFGIVTAEAALRGCVPLLNEDCGAAEYFEDGIDCVKTRRDAASFANSLTRILNGELDMEKIAKNSIRTVQNRFRLTDAAASYEKVLSEVARAFDASDCELGNARIMAMLVERMAFAQLEEDLSEHRRSTDWLKDEVRSLSEALAEAKNGINAYDMALTGAKHKVDAAEQELANLKNSRIWKFRDLLKRIGG